MIHSKKLTAILGSCAMATALGVAPAMVAADDGPTGQAFLIQAQDEQQFDDAMIEAFAQAQMRVAELQALYAAQYEAAETDEQRLQISEEATAEMMAAVEATPGITLEEYTAVVEAANEDPALVERINEAIESAST
ncbi:MAG: DUF4168 domain-containing protein [Roseicyclus sp.]